jgi:5-methylcytosine-specific restriction endonuclease McrA
MNLEHYVTLKLDASWRPVEIIPATEALIMDILNKCNVVETWDRTVSTPRQIFKLPSVIVLKDFTLSSKHKIKCTRKNVLLRDQNTCQYCGDTHYCMTIDHVIPKSKGGKFDWNNLVTSCEKCNQKKGDRTPEAANMKLLSKPEVPNSKYVKIFNSVNLKPEWMQYIA